jgi:flagellar protein FliL
MRKLLPVILALVGLGAGVGAGLALRPDPAPVVIDPCGDLPDEEGHAANSAEHGDEGGELSEYVKLNNQFIVPVVDTGAVGALVILSISLEVRAGSTDKVYTVEPKLRDTFLQVLFDHANAGGFDGTYTNANNMDVLRMALLETARQTLGDVVTDVLIVDIVRQAS